MVKKLAKKSKVKKNTKRKSLGKVFSDRAKKFKKKIKITKDDLKGTSLDKMMDKSYGKKGTPKRKAAEKKINAKAKTLVADNKKKEAFEKAMSLLPKTLTTKNLSEVIDNFPKKTKYGFTRSETDSLLEKYGIDKPKFYKELGINTVIMVDGEFVTYDSDIEKSLQCVLEGRTKTAFEWD